MGIANNKGGDDTSGLYDLKELATSAKKRRSQRLSSEMDAQQSLLQSSAALSAVALPDPKKSQEIAVPTVPLAGLDAPTSTSTSSETSAATVASRSVAMQFTEQASSSSSTRGWLLAGVLLLIATAAGAAAFVFLSGGSESSSAPDPALAASAPESEIATPVQALPALADDQDDMDEAAADEAEVPEVAPLDEESAAPAAEEVATAAVSKNNTESAKKAEAAAAAEAKSESKSARDDEAKDNASKDKPSKSEATASKQEVKEPKEPVKTEDLDSNASVDDILSTVTGGIDEHKSVEEDKGPSKKRLERGDVAKAMKKVSPAAKACYSAEEFSGVVTVKYSVDQDGKVSGAQATGPHKSSKTGACVVNAVKGASFPPFSGAAMSFSFPFLLSP